MKTLKEKVMQYARKNIRKQDKYISDDVVESLATQYWVRFSVNEGMKKCIGCQFSDRCERQSNANILWCERLGNKEISHLDKERRSYERRTLSNSQVDGSHV